MNREVHARFWERAEVKFLRATRQSRPVRPSNGSVHARYALKADAELTDLCRLMVPRCTLYKLPKESLV